VRTMHLPHLFKKVNEFSLFDRSLSHVLVSSN
jgi:hypothetical protein